MGRKAKPREKEALALNKAKVEEEKANLDIRLHDLDTFIKTYELLNGRGNAERRPYMTYTALFKAVADPANPDPKKVNISKIVQRLTRVATKFCGEEREAPREKAKEEKKE